MYDTKHLRRSLGAVALSFLSTNAFSAPPILFGQWTETGGVISALCPTGFTCESNVSGSGMKQRMLRGPGGKSYIQQIISETKPDSSLTMESFVSADGLSGISLRQYMTSTGAEDTMTAESVFNTGWANVVGQSAIQLTQNVARTVDYINNDKFSYRQNRDANDNITGYYLDIDQEVDFTSLGRRNRAVIRQAGGDEVINPGTISLPAAVGTMMGNGPNGGTVTWAAGDEVKVVWLGASCWNCRGMGYAYYMYQAYDNLSDTSAGIATLSMFAPDPVNWTEPFGTQPLFGP